MYSSCKYTVMGLLVTCLVACGAAEGPVQEDPIVVPESPTVLIAETPVASPTAPAASSPAPEATTTVEEPAAPSSLPLAEQAVALVSRESGIPADEIEVVSQEEFVWRDSALGCPEPGGNYLQVLTPGVQIILEAAGETIYVHGNENGSRLFICANPDEPVNPETRDVPIESTVLGSPAAAIEIPAPATATPSIPTIAATATREEAATMPPTTTPSSDSGTAASAPLAQQAILLVAQETGLAPDSLTVTEQQEVVWRDSALGCPQPGMNYLQVLTPGYRILVQSGSDTYHVHGNRRGALVFCKNPSEPLESSADK